MNNITFKLLPQITGGELVQGLSDYEIHDLITDSRKANPSKNSVFFAIEGARNDGHKFISTLYKLGCRLFVIEKQIEFSPFPEGNFLKVPSSIKAIQNIAAYKRDLFSIPVIGITGSNGKTIVKEWLSQLLSPDYNIVKNPASYNSQLGVPISVWQMDRQHTIGIFEAGISRADEMKFLQKIIKPTIGIFTNVLSAHDEGFNSREQKANEKANLFSEADVIVYCKDHEIIDRTLQKNQAKRILFNWGSSDTTYVQVLKLDPQTYQVQYKGISIKISKKFTDAASWENLFHCIATLIYLGYPLTEIQSRINQIKSLPMRLELKAGINGCTLIDDSYSNDLAGLSIALDFFESQRSGKGVVFLSDLIESGLDQLEWVERVNSLLEHHKIDRLIAIGPAFKKNRSRLSIANVVYESVEECLKNYSASELTQATVLIKGARAFHFERIAQHFQRKIHGTVMEIDLNSIVHNLNVFRAHLKPETKIMAMVKAFAYGSGSNEVASALQYNKVDYLGVAYADEGKWLRSKGIHIPIMVMNPSAESFSTVIEFDLEPSIYSLSLFQQLIDHLQGAEIFIHLKLDTGMHRLGFVESEMDELVHLLEKSRNIKIKSIYSHLSGSDEAIHDRFTEHQVAFFYAMCDRISTVIHYPVLKHILNTAGISRLNQYQFDMVRLGIGLYGVDPGNELASKLYQAITLRTTISQIKVVKKGETIGYGRHGQSTGEMKIATLSIGYADGFSRAFSTGVGKVLIKNKLAPVIGNVCMDMTMVNVTGIDVNEGEEAIIFGRELLVTEVAKWINTIPYEILTSTSDRVKRVFFAESV